MLRNVRQEGAMAPEHGPSSPMFEIPGYQILERLGKGSMGEVFLARQLALGRLVAIKFLMPEGGADSEHDLARFRREAELMAKISHPNVLPIHDFGEADGRPYLVMEYVKEGDLRRRMPAGHVMPVDEVRRIILPVGEALAYLHRQEIIHRDLKPENILLHDDEHPRVADFGIAVLRAGAGSLTRAGCGMGTLGYVAPEQQYCLKVDERADQYSLGALAYEMLTGHLPLGVFKPPSQLNPRLGPEVDAVILRSLEESPKNRFATIREFTAALDRCLAPAPSSGRWGSRRFALAGLSLLIIVGAVSAYLAWPSARVTTPPRGLLTIPRQADAPDKGAASAGGDTASKAPESLSEKLKELRARKIWESRGSPTGQAGEAVKDEIWHEAERRLYERLAGKAPPNPGTK